MARFQFKNRKNNGLIFFISFMVMGEAAIAAPLPQWANAPAVTPVAQLSLQESTRCVSKSLMLHCTR